VTRPKYILLIIANTAGVVVSLYSLFFTEKLNNYILDIQLICDFNKAFSCSTTYISKYAFIFNLPVSLFALLFFWYILFFLLLNRQSETNERSYQMLALLNAIALIICACFLYVLIFILRNICPSCFFIDLIVFMNFILLFGSLRKNFNADKGLYKELLRGNWLFLISFLLLFASGLVLYKVYRSIINTKNKELAKEFLMQKPVKETECRNSIVWGNENGISFMLRTGIAVH